MASQPAKDKAPAGFARRGDLGNAVQHFYTLPAGAWCTVSFGGGCDYLERAPLDRRQQALSMES
ncbi:hypothetical protein D0Y60_12605 [Shinella sp. WSJ-2]|nr:hypothetical protein D0Y60_12605 [Shinella sp. WSJ-2]